MVRASLILLTLLAGCQSVQERAGKAAALKGQAQASAPFPDLPSACTAKMERVKPKPSEPRVITLKRWDVVAENRDRQSVDCARWGEDMKKRPPT